MHHSRYFELPSKGKVKVGHAAAAAVASTAQQQQQQQQQQQGRRGAISCL